MKLPITDIERIALSPGPSGRGQFLGKNLGACGGMCVGFLAGVIVFPQSLGVREEGINGLRSFIIAGALGGGRVQIPYPIKREDLYGKPSLPPLRFYTIFMQCFSGGFPGHIPLE